MLRRQNGVPYLRASNPLYPDLIPAQEVVIHGVLIAFLRLSKDSCHDSAL